MCRVRFVDTDVSLSQLVQLEWISLRFVNPTMINQTPPLVKTNSQFSINHYTKSQVSANNLNYTTWNFWFLLRNPLDNGFHSLFVLYLFLTLLWSSARHRRSTIFLFLHQLPSNQRLSLVHIHGRQAPRPHWNKSVPLRRARHSLGRHVSGNQDRLPQIGQSRTPGRHRS